MANSKSTRAKSAHPNLGAAVPTNDNAIENLNDAPINVIDDRLRQAYATLDLIYTLTIKTDIQDELLETLSAGTLGASRRRSRQWSICLEAAPSYRSMRRERKEGASEYLTAQQIVLQNPD